MKYLLRPLLLLLAAFFTSPAQAEAWYSGPLLSDPSIVTPIGHGYFQMHIFKSSVYGAYDSAFNFESLPRATTGEIDTTFNYGLTKDSEMQLIVTYLNNKTENRASGNLGDTNLTFSKQLTLQDGRKWPPNIKVMYRQIFPTGRFDQLNASLFATDATGQGSYLSTLAFNMEHVLDLGGERYLVGFATVAFTLAKSFKLVGPSIYGGGLETNGVMWPGNSMAFNLAAEYTPSKHWGFIMETYIYTQEASHFTGDLGPVPPRFTYEGNDRRIRLFSNIFRRVAGRRIIFNRLRPSHLNLGGSQDIGHGSIAQFTLAPAIDYTFNKNTSLTLGTWFTVAGKNATAFYAPMLNFTANW